MDFTVQSRFYDNISGPPQPRPYRTPTSVADQPQPIDNVVYLPYAGANTSRNNSTGTQLISETQSDLPDGGYHRIRTFARSDGRTFTRVENFLFTESGTQRSVIQENPSGNVTRYDEILERQDDGNFRRTQTFQDESGDISMQINTDYQVKDPFILSGGIAGWQSGYIPYNPTRGTQLDIQA